MATLASSPPSSPSWPKRRPRAWALRCERYCCAALSCFPLAFVYGLTTWAAYTEISIGLGPTRSSWIGIPTSILGGILYILLNISYTVAVFTDPGSPLKTTNSRHEYSALPVTELPEYTSYTVSSTGGSRFCKKCQCPKPDRAHHCSTCKRCVLKMDHHCPWLATCVGMYNYKAFLLFLLYTSLFCWVDFGVSAVWIWTEVLNDTHYMDSFLPVNVVLLAILGGIIGLVLTGFTIWHISLAVRGMTTIECLEKTRYVSPLRNALDRNRYENILGHGPQHAGEHPTEALGHRLQDYGSQILDAHANAIPGVTRPEEGEERISPTPGRPRSEDHHRREFEMAPRQQSQDYHQDQSHTHPGHSHPSQPPYPSTFTPAQQALTRSYADLEHQRDHDRYQTYLNEEDNEKMPNAFDQGWRGNLLHLFGPRPLLWPIPISTTTGDGWRWDPSPKFLEARERLRQRREQENTAQQVYYRDLYQRNMGNRNRNGWMGAQPSAPPAAAAAGGWTPSQPLENVRDPERPATGVSMRTLAPMSPRPRPGDSEVDSEVEGEGSGDEQRDLLRGNRRQEDDDEWRDWE